LPAADDWIAATLARPDDRRSLPAWLGIDPGAACVVTNADPWTEVARRVADSKADTLVDTATALGLACARVGEIGPTAPVLLKHAGEAPTRPLTGLRVVNLASLWAGPLAADVLVRLGADVVCVESIRRPDGARATRRWFDAMHAGQRSFAFDHRSEGDVSQLAEVLASAHVVIEGSRPRALQQLGLSAESLVRRGPQVWLSITGYGREGPEAMRIGLGDDSAAAGGLVGWLSNGPVFLADAIADPVTGLVVAHTICDLVTSGGRWLVDIALARVASAAAPRPSDPSVARVHRPLQPAPVAGDAKPLELGAHTESVLRDWLTPSTVI
jgi:crotonobetainyl-CoA:carnitine CoA-transferase CaiB-like acyl-CoA transferase